MDVDSRQRGIAIVAACIAAALLLSPALFAGFYGDDFLLWHVGQQALDDPKMLLIGPGNFYRPVK